MMKHTFQLTAWIAISLLLFSPLSFSQDGASDAEPAIEEDNNTAPDQEVEVNEDNYRQFMELKDAGLQRPGMPETAYKSQAGLQTLDKLPEESQKHLREQLREIIVQGDPWKPGDENTNYPYTPSEAATSDQPLQKQEAEAWGDLVESYHQREAQIYGNAARSRAAAAAAGQSPGQNSGNGSTGENGSGASGEQDSATQQAGQQGAAQQKSAAGSYSPGSSSEQNEKSSAGVSQNAMEFLKAQSGSASGSPPGGNNSATGHSNQQPPAAQAEVNQDAQNALEFLKTQSGTAASAAATADNSTPASAEPSQGTPQLEAKEDAQNALEFLQSNSAAESASAEDAPSAATPSPDADVSVSQEDAQNALEYLSGDTQTPAAPGAEEGTLSIEELRNVQGVFNPADENTQPVVDDEPQ